MLLYSRSSKLVSHIVSPLLEWGIELDWVGSIPTRSDKTPLILVAEFCNTDHRDVIRAKV